MPEEQKTVFISYRREPAAFHARAIFQDLYAHGYDVFMDVENINSGQFEQIIFNQIEARAHFLVILTPDTVERCANPNDMMRREIEFAIDSQRNIVPLLIKGFSFGEVQPFLTGKLAQLSGFNGIPVFHEYFPEAMERLRTRFLQLPVYGILKAAPESEQAEAQRKIEEAAAQPLPTETQLASEEQLHLASQMLRERKLDKALAYYDEAIRLNSQYANAFNNRGNILYLKRDFKGAIADFTEAIRLDPYNFDAYANRGNVRYKAGDMNGAINDYDEAVRMNPQYARAYSDRGYIRYNTGDIDGAMIDYDKAIRLDPSLFFAYGNRSIVRFRKRDFIGWLSDFWMYVRLWRKRRPNLLGRWGRDVLMELHTKR